MTDTGRRSVDPTSPPVIRAVDLHKVFPRGRERVEALRGVDLEVPRGAFVVVRGPSGAGKSTLLHLLGGIDRPSEGAGAGGGMGGGEEGDCGGERYRARGGQRARTHPLSPRPRGLRLPVLQPFALAL